MNRNSACCLPKMQTDAAIAPVEGVHLCSVCRKTPEDPRKLPCNHVSCLKCLDAAKERPRRLHLRSSFKIRCPTCRAKHITKQISVFPSCTVSAQTSGNTQRSLVDQPKCENHPLNDVEKVCSYHNVPVCKTCVMYAHRRCNLLGLDDGDSHLRSALKAAFVQLGEKRLVPLYHTLRRGEADLQRVHELGEKCREQIQTVAAGDDGIPSEESKTAFTSYQEALQKCKDSFDVAAAPRRSDMSDCVTLCQEISSALNEDEGSGPFLQLSHALLAKVKSFLKSNQSPLVAWRGPLDFQYQVGNTSVTVVARAWEVTVQEGTEAADQSKPDDDEVALTAYSVEDAVKELERQEAARAAEYQPALHKVLLHVRQCKTEMGPLAPDSMVTGRTGVSYQSHVADEVRAQQEKQDKRNQSIKHASSKQQEHLLTQSQRADELRRQREEKQEQQRQEMLRAREEQQARQEEQRRKAKEARQQQEEARRRKQEEQLRDLQQRKEKKAEEYGRRQEVRRQQQEKQQDRHDEAKDKRKQQQEKRSEEQKHLLEEFRKQQSMDLHQQQVVLQERSAVHQSKQQQEVMQVTQALQRQQEKHKALQQTRQDSRRMEQEREQLQKVEQKHQERQQVLHSQQLAEQEKEQRVLTALQKKRESQQQQLEEISKHRETASQQQQHLGSRSVLDSNQPEGGAEPKLGELAVENKQPALEDLTEEEPGNSKKRIRQGKSTLPSVDSSSALLKQQQEKQRLQKEETLRKHQEEERQRQQQVQQVLQKHHEQRQDHHQGSDTTTKKFLERQQQQKRQKQEASRQQREEEQRREEEIQQKLQRQRAEKEQKAKETASENIFEHQERAQQKHQEAVERQRKAEAEQQQKLQITLSSRQQTQATLQRQLSQ